MYAAGSDVYPGGKRQESGGKAPLHIDLLMSAVPLPGWAKGIGVYGSFAEGTDTADSDIDIDLWVLVNEYTPELEMLAAKVGKIGRKNGSRNEYAHTHTEKGIPALPNRYAVLCQPYEIKYNASGCVN